MRRSKHTRKDVNHAQIVRMCRQLGIVVFDVADVGGTCPDTFMVWRGRCLPVEIKAIGKRHDLTEGEKVGRDRCSYNGVSWVIAESIDDILEAFAIIGNRTNEERLARHLLGGE